MMFIFLIEFVLVAKTELILKIFNKKKNLKTYIFREVFFPTTVKGLAIMRYRHEICIYFYRHFPDLAKKTTFGCIGKYFYSSEFSQSRKKFLFFFSLKSSEKGYQKILRLIPF